MGIKLGDVSPLAGVITGKGAFGNLASSGALGIAPALIADKAQDKTAAKLALAEEAAKKEEAVAALKKATGMKKGGSVGSASKRADGCAIRGKTRA
jgi:hypothetical protein